MLACLDDLFTGHGEGAGWQLPRRARAGGGRRDAAPS
jgi:muramoyltetrapeptide carboxypeptidase